MLDGRIHPHRIEEVFEQARHEVERLCQRAAEDALVEVGITDLHPELMTLLGRLRYRTSYGQNVLKHLVETAHIAGIMAAELRLDAAADQAVRVPARHRQGAHPRGRGQPRADRRRPGPQVRRVRRRRARHRGAPQRGAAADHRGRAHPGLRRLLGRAAGRAAGEPRGVRQAARAHRGDRRPASPASRRSSRCRPAARSGSWCARTTSTTSARPCWPATWPSRSRRS